MDVVVSSSHIVSAAPSSSGGRLLTLFPCSILGSLPQQTVLHELVQCESFHGAEVLCKLPSVGPSHGVTSPDSKSARAWDPLSTGPARSLLQRGLPTGSQPPSGTHLLRRGVPYGLQVEICSSVTLHGCRGIARPAMGCTTGCRGIAAPAPGAPPPLLLH